MDKKRTRNNKAEILLSVAGIFHKYCFRARICEASKTLLCIKPVEYRKELRNAIE